MEIPDIPWENLIEVKSKEIEELKQEIESLKLAYTAQSQIVPHAISKKKTSDPSQCLSNDLYSKFHIEKLRDIFFRYATVFSSNENLLDLSHFRLIFKELLLGCKDLNLQKAELMYHSVGKRANLDFEKFVKLIKKIAYQRFKSNDYLEKLVPLLKIPEKRLDIIDKNIQQWIEDSQSIRIKELMNSYEDLLRTIFSVYCSKEVQYQGKVTLANLLEFCADCKIVPAIVSNLEVARVFRFVETEECLNFEDFLISFACLGILGMGKIGISNPIHAIDKILVILSGNSEFVFTKKNQGYRWKTEKN